MKSEIPICITRYGEYQQNQKNHWKSHQINCFSEEVSRSFCSCTHEHLFFLHKVLLRELFLYLKFYKLFKSFIEKLSNVCMVYLVLRDRDQNQYSEYFYLSVFLHNTFCHNIGGKNIVWETFYNERLSSQALQKPSSWRRG